MAKALMVKGSILGDHLLFRSAAVVKSRPFYAPSSLEVQRLFSQRTHSQTKPKELTKSNLTKSPSFQLPAINSRSSNRFSSSCTQQKPEKDQPENAKKSRKIDVSYEELCALMLSGEITLIDVREPKELEAHGRIPKATNIPLGQLESAFQISPEKLQSLYGTELEDDDGHQIVFYCRMGVRSLTAIAIAERMGYEGARHVPGGYEEWRARQADN